MLKVLKKREKLLYHHAGVDTTGMSGSGDMNVPVKKSEGPISKFFKFIAGGTKGINKNQWLTGRRNEIAAELRQMRSAGTLPKGIKPNEINSYARAQAESEWKKQEEEYDPLGIKK